jgi:hypothetical protein
MLAKGGQFAFLRRAFRAACTHHDLTGKPEIEDLAKYRANTESAKEQSRYPSELTVLFRDCWLGAIAQFALCLHSMAPVLPTIKRSNSFIRQVSFDFSSLLATTRSGVKGHRCQVLDHSTNTPPISSSCEKRISSQHDRRRSSSKTPSWAAQASRPIDMTKYHPSLSSLGTKHRSSDLA